MSPKVLPQGKWIISSSKEGVNGGTKRKHEVIQYKNID